MFFVKFSPKVAIRRSLLQRMVCKRDGVGGVLMPAGVRVRCVAHKPDASRRACGDAESVSVACHIAQVSNTAPKHRHTDPVLILCRDISLSISYITDLSHKSVLSRLTIHMANI